METDSDVTQTAAPVDPSREIKTQTDSEQSISESVGECSQMPTLKETGQVCESSPDECMDVDPTKKSVTVCDSATTKCDPKSGGATPATIQEGQAKIIFPSANEVFYNPVQQFNRDLTIAVINVHAEENLTSKGLKVSYEPRDEGATDQEPAPSVGNGRTPETRDTYHPGEYCQEGLCILEGLSATGLRGVRYAKEIPGLKNIIANDWNQEAYKTIERNIQQNGVEHLVTASHSDASLLMNRYRLSERVDVVDLDPYGSPAKFLNGSVQAVKDGGLLCVTCTDMAVLCGNRSEACYAKYGAMSLRTKYCQEMALRIVLHSIETHANLFHRYIEPLVSVSVDFYIRLFVRVHTSQSKVKQSASKKALVYHCEGCDNFHLQRMGRMIQTDENAKNFRYKSAFGPPVSPTCDNCGCRFLLGGPIWAEPMHNLAFVEKLLTQVNTHSDRFHTSPRIKGILTLISEELIDCPLYHKFSQLFHHVRSACPSLKKFRSALLHAGYQVSLSHITAEAIKTNAPHSVVWDIVKEWVKLNPVSRKRKLDDKSISHVILSKQSRTTVSFDVREDAMPMSHKQGMPRFPANPAPNWGPKARAKPSSSSETLEEKRARLQDKRTKQRDKTETGTGP